MADFDRWDILAAYNVYSCLWGGDGCRYENGIQCRLSRLKYHPSGSDQALETLSPNAKEIYGALVRKHQGSSVAYGRWHKRRPDVFQPWPGIRNVGSYTKYVKERLGLDPACLYVWS